MLLQSYMYISLHHQLFITAAARIAEEIPRRTRISYMMAFRSLSLFVRFLVYTQFLKSTRLTIWIFWPANLRMIYWSKCKATYVGPKQRHCLSHHSLTHWLAEYFIMKLSCDKERQYIVLFYTGIWMIHGQHFICIVKKCMIVLYFEVISGMSYRLQNLIYINHGDGLKHRFYRQ